MSRDRYASPLSARYSSKEMQYIFSDDMRYTTWRKLWVALAEAQRELGLDITLEQINELRNHVNDINYDEANKKEKEIRHDVMAHIHAYGLQCPKAKGIIHLGATSCYVGDNADIIMMKEGLLLIRKKLINLISILSGFADRYKDVATLGFTHFQAAQPTTVGKRATLWLQDFASDFEEAAYILTNMRMLGSKGTTGTQASFLELFDGDYERVRKIDKIIAHKFGFAECVRVSGQTYSRKTDSRILSFLSQVSQSACKMSNDIRLLQHLKELEEPFESRQVGSSAMAYKRNPMRCERIAALSRAVISNSINADMTAATQWLERTLDDSANRRLSIATGFLAVDGILDLCLNVTNGLIVYPKMTEKHLRAELPFMATENIMMQAVKNGADRQEIHERIRVLSMQAAKKIKQDGEDNSLLELIAADPVFNLTEDELNELMQPEKYIGCASMQVDAFLHDYINPLLEDNHKLLGSVSAEISI